MALSRVAGLQWCETQRVHLLKNALAPTPEVGPLGFQEGRQAGLAMGRWQAPPGVVKVELRDRRGVQVGKYQK